MNSEELVEATGCNHKQYSGCALAKTWCY